MYSEDTDLFARLLGKGFAVTWVADAVVTHPHPTESAGDSRRRAAEAVRSELRYMRNTTGGWGHWYTGSVSASTPGFGLCCSRLPGCRAR